MATKFLHEAQRGASRGSIDFPLALLAGLSVGFVAFVLPAELLSRAVELSQLPSILPAAEPPLGNKARAALAAVAAGGTILAVFLLLRMLGRQAAPPQRREREAAASEPGFEAPRLRRADVHPDAPARRPILAARELGEPAPARVPSRPAMSRPDAFAPAPDDELIDDVASDELELSGPDIQMIAPTAPAAPTATHMPAPPPEPEPEPEPVIPAPVAVAAVGPPPAAEPAVDASIADLMARLERGLARRRQDQQDPDVGPPVPTAANSGFPEPERGDDRLRSAIENLQKMAARAR